jgi:hypothetical protein
MITDLQKRNVRRLAREAFTSAQIADELDLRADDVDSFIDDTERGTIDIARLYSHQLGRQPASTKELWEQLFSEYHMAKTDAERKDARDAIIIQALNFVRKYNDRTPQYIRADCSMYATQRVIAAVDHCLTTNLPSEKSSAYCRQTVINSINNARKGRARQYVPANVRTSQPKTRTNRDLEMKLRQSGLSESMIECELHSAGFQPAGRTRVVENQWPVNRDNESADYAGNASGKRRRPQHRSEGAAESPLIESLHQSDDLELLEEILTQEQFDYLRLRIEGYTREEIENEFKVPTDEQDRIMLAIRRRVADYRRQHPDDV